MNEGTRETGDERLLVEAARWMERARSGGDEDRKAFRRWLSERPEHVAAMDLVSRSWDMAPAAARAAGLALRTREAGAGRPAAWLRLAPAGGLALAGLGAALLWSGSVDQRLYSTGPHERRAVVLADGSRAWLAPSSRLAMRTTPLGRSATLEGEAAFDVRHEWRGFAVVAGGIRTVDRGTVFSVSDRGGKLSVLLERGRVVVEDAASGAVIAAPEPGQYVEIDARGAVVSDVDAEDALAWRDGRIVARDLPLRVVLARFASQGGASIRLADPRLAMLRVSGSYAIGDVEPFLTALAALHPIAWKRVGNGYEVRSRP